MRKFNIADIEKAITLLKTKYAASNVAMQFDDMGRLLLKASDISGGVVVITIFDESTQKMAEITITERL